MGQYFSFSPPSLIVVIGDFPGFLSCMKTFVRHHNQEVLFVAQDRIDSAVQGQGIHVVSFIDMLKGTESATEHNASEDTEDSICPELAQQSKSKGMTNVIPKQSVAQFDMETASLDALKTINQDIKTQLSDQDIKTQLSDQDIKTQLSDQDIKTQLSDQDIPPKASHQDTIPKTLHQDNASNNADLLDENSQLKGSDQDNLLQGSSQDDLMKGLDQDNSPMEQSPKDMASNDESTEIPTTPETLYVRTNYYLGYNLLIYTYIYQGLIQDFFFGGGGGGG